MGHTDIRTAMQVYNHVDEGCIKKMDKLEDLGKKLPPNLHKFTQNEEKVMQMNVDFYDICFSKRPQIPIK